MKIIHTGDWHLGHRLYNYDRTDEEEHFFRQLTELMRTERPDALVVSGDIFHTCAPGNDVAKRFTDRLLAVQAASPETEVVVIAGNHDSYSRLEIDRSLWTHCHVRIFGTPEETRDGFADFTRNIVELPGKGLIAAVPFCHERNFPAVAGTSGENRQEAYFSGMQEQIKTMNEKGLPTVLVAHLAAGSEISFSGQEKDAVIGGEECVEPDVLGTGYDYIALGHIHCPQWVKGETNRIRYCGTPRAIHFDETYRHGVDVVEIEHGKEPQLRTVEFAPLRKLVTFGGEEGLLFDDVLKALNEATPDEGTYIRLNARLGWNALPEADWTERGRSACQAKNVRFCLVNPIREKEPQHAEGNDTTSRKTIAELKELKKGEVVDILAKVHDLTEEHRKMLETLIDELDLKNNK